MAESKMTPEEIMKAVSNLKVVENTVVVDYCAELERLKAENARLRSEKIALQNKVERLQSQLRPKYQERADYVPYPDYEDR